MTCKYCKAQFLELANLLVFALTERRAVPEFSVYVALYRGHNGVAQLLCKGCSHECPANGRHLVVKFLRWSNEEKLMMKTIFQQFTGNACHVVVGRLGHGQPVNKARIGDHERSGHEEIAMRLKVQALLEAGGFEQKLAELRASKKRPRKAKPNDSARLAQAEGTGLINQRPLVNFGAGAPSNASPSSR